MYFQYKTGGFGNHLSNILMNITRREQQNNKKYCKFV